MSHVCTSVHICIQIARLQIMMYTFLKHFCFEEFNNHNHTKEIVKTILWSVPASKSLSITHPTKHYPDSVKASDKCTKGVNILVFIMSHLFNPSFHT